MRDVHGVERLQGIDFTLRSGEIVGVAGVAGNGQTELLEVFFRGSNRVEQLFRLST